MQERTSKNKLYSLHAPEVVCIAKGKAHRPYEFGSKVALAVTNREGFVLASKALEGNPYDGHTLNTTIDQVVALSGVEPDRIYVDQGYRGHDYDKNDRVFITRSAGPHADDQAGAATPVRDRADDRAHEGGRAVGTQLTCSEQPAMRSMRCWWPPGTTCG